METRRCPECRGFLLITKGAEDSKLVSVLMPESYLEGLHELVRGGVYPRRVRSSGPM